VGKGDTVVAGMNVVLEEERRTYGFCGSRAAPEIPKIGKFTWKEVHRWLLLFQILNRDSGGGLVVWGVSVVARMVVVLEELGTADVAKKTFGAHKNSYNLPQTLSGANSKDCMLK
jgi:hypothetical protein